MFSGTAQFEVEGLSNSSFHVSCFFSDGFFFPGKPSDLYDKTNPDWAPSIKLGYNNFKSSKGKCDILDLSEDSFKGHDAKVNRTLITLVN